MSSPFHPETALARLQNLDRAALVALWQETHDCPPPANVRKDFLVRDAAWHLQAKCLGSLSPQTRRMLKSAKSRLAADLKLPRSGESPGPQEQKHEGHGAAPAPCEPALSPNEGTDKPPSNRRREAVSSPSRTEASRHGTVLNKSAHDLPPYTPHVSPPSPLRISAARQSPSPGARLIREWNGRTHVVDVTENGYVLDGKTFASLSAIARHITGAHWSGPRFFGL